jgi:hypothetical protein
VRYTVVFISTFQHFAAQWLHSVNVTCPCPHCLTQSCNNKGTA